MRRPVMITLWIVAGFFTWLTLLYFSVFALLRHGGENVASVYRSVSDSTMTVFIFYGVFGIGTLAIIALVGYLGLRGRLPGTRIKPRAEEVPGFPVSESQIARRDAGA